MQFWYTIQVDELGRVKLPEEFCTILGLHPGTPCSRILLPDPVILLFPSDGAPPLRDAPYLKLPLRARRVMNLSCGDTCDAVLCPDLSAMAICLPGYRPFVAHNKA